MKRLYTDASVCQGCHLCELICSLIHLKDEVNPRRARIRVHDDLFNKTFVLVVCHQCGKAPCIPACPHEAIFQDPAWGTPVIDTGRCTACLACLNACPFGAIFYDEESRLPIVCDLCSGDPKCILFCPTHPTKTHSALNYVTSREWGILKARPMSQTNNSPA